MSDDPRYCAPRHAARSALRSGVDVGKVAYDLVGACRREGLPDHAPATIVEQLRAEGLIPPLPAPSRPLPPARDRLVRRARSIFRHHSDPTNPRRRCCRRPDPREVPDAAVYTTKCENCGATL